MYFHQTKRLGFRTWLPGDLDLALGLWGDPLVTRLIDSRGALSPAEVAERLAVEIATFAEHGVQYWPAFLLSTGEHVGCCGLRPRGGTGAAREYELGVHIRSSHWGRGYAEESACAVIEYAFGTLGVASLFAGHNPENDESRRLLLKLGFRFTHEELYPPTGRMHPSYVLVRAPSGYGV